MAQAEQRAFRRKRQRPTSVCALVCSSARSGRSHRVFERKWHRCPRYSARSVFGDVYRQPVLGEGPLNCGNASEGERGSRYIAQKEQRSKGRVRFDVNAKTPDLYFCRSGAFPGVPPAGFEPAHTAPEAVALYVARWWYAAPCEGVSASFAGGSKDAPSLTELSSGSTSLCSVGKPMRSRPSGGSSPTADQSEVERTGSICQCHVNLDHVGGCCVMGDGDPIPPARPSLQACGMPGQLRLSTRLVVASRLIPEG